MIMMKRFAAISCHDHEKWGGSEGIAQRYIDIYSLENEEWSMFHASKGDVPTVSDLHKYDGFLISGSINSVNDDLEWIRKLEEFVHGAASLDRTKKHAKVVGICFGHQLIAKALGGKVQYNPSGEFVLQTEKITGTEASPNYKPLKCLFDMHGPLRLMESHSECIADLPDGATTIATSATCQHEVVEFTDNIIGLQSHPEMHAEEAAKLILPVISKDYQWDQEKIHEVTTSINLTMDSDKINQTIKHFLRK